MELKVTARRAMEENGTKHEGTAYELGRYKVDKYIATYETGYVYKRIIVSVPWEERENYIPEIYYEDDYYGTHTPRFEIQTAAYGALSPEEIAKVIAGYQEALEAVKILTKEFC